MQLLPKTGINETPCPGQVHFLDDLRQSLPGQSQAFFEKQKLFMLYLIRNQSQMYAVKKGQSFQPSKGIVLLSAQYNGLMDSIFALQLGGCGLDPLPAHACHNDFCSSWLNRA